MSRENAGKAVIKAADWNVGDKKLADFLSDFKYQPELTKKLDSAGQSFSQQLINEIILWKVNRYAKIPNDLLESLNGVRNLRPGQHKRGESELKNLLACSGVRLPMASTILRFANPKVFQIYDRHICRAMYGRCDKVAPKASKKAVETYWLFLDELVNLCAKLKIPFKNADRILYCFDKAENPPLSETES